MATAPASLKRRVAAIEAQAQEPAAAPSACVVVAHAGDFTEGPPAHGLRIDVHGLPGESLEDLAKRIAPRLRTARAVVFLPANGRDAT